MPPPGGRWVHRQTWHDLLFAHWPAPAATLQPLVPAPLTIQEHSGTSWVGLVAFRMTGVTARGLPAMPWLSAFPEMNLRLYIDLEGRPGVWFISLDAGNPLAVWAARRFFHLPYFHATMQVHTEGDRVRYRSERRGPGPRVAFRGSYWPTGAAVASTAGTLEHFLTERYRLYTRAANGTLLTAEIRHRPWPLQPAAAEIDVNDVATAQGIRVDGPPALLHFSKRLDVHFWRMTGVTAAPT